MVHLGHVTLDAVAVIPCIGAHRQVIAHTEQWKHFAPLRDMGAAAVQDLLDLTALDFTRLGMKDLQRRRLKDALDRHSKGLSSSSPGASSST